MPNEEVKKTKAEQEGRLFGMNGTWVCITKIPLTEAQKKELHERLRDFMNSDALLEGIVELEDMDIGYAAVAYGEPSLAYAIEGMSEQAAASFKERATKLPETIQ